MNLSIAPLLHLSSSKGLSEKDYYPGGMVMPERIFNSLSYHFGYQGSLKNDDIKGSGNSYSTFFRENDPRLARWWSIDPLFRKTPGQSPYISMGNNPILYCDKLGNLFGIEGLGSNKKQRQDAREIANRHQGQINGLLSKHINVTYSGYSNDLEQEPEKQNFIVEFYSDGSATRVGFPSEMQSGPPDPYTDMRRFMMQNAPVENHLSLFDKLDRKMKMNGPDPYEGKGGFQHALPLIGKTALTVGTLGYFAEGYATMSLFSRILGYSALTFSVDNLTKSSSGTILEQGANEIAGAHGVQGLNGLRTTVELLSLANSGRSVFQTAGTGSFPTAELGAFGIDGTKFIMSTQELKESLETE